MSDQNRGVVYLGPGQVEVREIPAAKLELDHDGRTRRCDHGAILRVVSTNICGSDQHMVRGRTTAPAGLVLGHDQIAMAVNATPLSLEEAPEGYRLFDHGAARKFVLDPNGYLSA